MCTYNLIPIYLHFQGAVEHALCGNKLINLFVATVILSLARELKEKKSPDHLSYGCSNIRVTHHIIL